MSNKNTSEKALNVVIAFEKQEGRNPENVSRNGCGYDIRSDGRFIEVKGVGEDWRTYNWQSLHRTEVECLQNNAQNFYLYIVKFTNREAEEVEGLYIIPGKDLKDKDKFDIKIESYRLSPISKESLKSYLIKDL